MYVIGGLVDRTVRKGASLGLAQRCGARAVRLPIAEHLGTAALGSSKGVLNVNDVFNALLAVHAGDSWHVALDAAIPRRFRQDAGDQQGQQQAAEQKGAAQPELRQEQQQDQQQGLVAAEAAAAEAAEGLRTESPQAARQQRRPAPTPCGCCCS